MYACQGRWTISRFQIGQASGTCCSSVKVQPIKSYTMCTAFHTLEQFWLRVQTYGDAPHAPHDGQGRSSSSSPRSSPPPKERFNCKRTSPSRR